MPTVECWQHESVNEAEAEGGEQQIHMNFKHEQYESPIPA